MSERLYAMVFADLYPAYVAKAEKKGRSRDEVDEIIVWLTGYSEDELAASLKDGRTVREFFTAAPMNPQRELITGSVCGVKLAEVEDPLMKDIRYLDKLIDELARGKSMEKILRKG